MIYVAHELKQKHIDFIRSKDNWVYLDNYNDPQNQNVMTFDGPYISLIEGKSQLQIPFEVFVLWNNLGTTRLMNTDQRFATWDECQELKEYGGKLEWHTRNHPRMINMNSDDIDYEITPAFDCDWFAYPYGDFDEATKQQVIKKYKGAVSVIQGNDTDKYCLNRKDIS